MKLRNKKTGEIVEAHKIDLIGNYVELKIFSAGDYDKKQYNSLVELNEEWEDYKPKELWSIDLFAEPTNVIGSSSIQLEQLKKIGNRFETREETKKAVEKLKALQRLKDKGFRFDGWYGGSRTIHFRIDSLDKEGDCLPHFMNDDMANDLDLLFSEKGVPVDRKSMEDYLKEMKNENRS